MRREIHGAHTIPLQAELDETVEGLQAIGARDLITVRTQFSEMSQAGQIWVRRINQPQDAGKM
jgi:hypothetical protein